MEWQEKGPEGLSFSERDFKVCDLCGALNPAANAECFVCGWNGRFQEDRETVRDAMMELANEYGEISKSLFTDETLPSTLPKPGFWAEIWGSLRKIFSRE